VGFPEAPKKILVAPHHHDSFGVWRPDRAGKRIGYRTFHLHFVLAACHLTEKTEPSGEVKGIE
jgi:hypothetical protein